MTLPRFCRESSILLLVMSGRQVGIKLSYIVQLVGTEKKCYSRASAPITQGGSTSSAKEDQYDVNQSIGEPGRSSANRM